MTIQFHIFNSENDGEGLSLIFSDGTLIPVTSEHAEYNEIKKILVLTPASEIDEKALLGLVQPGLAAGVELTRLSERVTYANGTIYFDGDVVDSAIAEHIIRIIREGGVTDAYAALVAFLEKISLNPSEKSRSSLYDFIVRHGITINKDGDFLVYKGVNANGTSIHSGFGIVNGVAQTGHLLNSKGAILEMPRSKVDADTARGCSTGLHAGTHSYASSFARGMLLLVKVNPRDVVSVPDDCNFKKIRVSRYEVIDQIAQEIKDTYADYSDDEYDDEDDEDNDYFSDDEVDFTVHNTIESVEEALNVDYDVDVTFDYVRGDGTTTTVENLSVNDVVTTDNGNVLIVGVRENGDVRSYRADRLSNLVVSVDGLDTAKDDAEVKVADKADAASTDASHDFFAYAGGSYTAPTSVSYDFTDANYVVVSDSISDALADGHDVFAKFDFTRTDRTAGSVTNLFVTEVRVSDKGNTLIIGERPDGKVRNYRVDRIQNLEVQVDKAFDVANLAPTATVTFAKVATPVAATSELDKIVEKVKGGETVTINFNYTKLDNSPRKLSNFEADGVINGNLLVGTRADGETRTYRIDRITDAEIVNGYTPPYIFGQQN